MNFSSIFNTLSGIENSSVPKQQALVNGLSLLLFPTLIIAIIANLVFSMKVSAILLIIYLILISILFFVNKKYTINNPFYLLYIFTIILICSLMVVADGVRDVTIILFPALVVVSGFLLDYKLFIRLSVLNFVVLILIGLIEYNGLIKTKLSDNLPIAYLVDLTIIMPFTMVVIYFLLRIAKTKEDKLQQSNYTKDRFLKILAHDLKNPFQSLKGSAEILEKEYYGLSDEERLLFINRINVNINNQIDLLEALLNWGKIQSGNYTVSFEENDLAIISKKVINPFYKFAEEKEIKITNKIEDKTIISCDEFLLTTAIRNLISNSLKYTPPKGQITLEVIDNNDRLDIILTDSGIGMSKEMVYQILNSEETDINPGLDGEIGTGLGFSLIKEFVKIHNAKFDIISNEGKGTRFIISLDTERLKEA